MVGHSSLQTGTRISDRITASQPTSYLRDRHGAGDAKNSTFMHRRWLNIAAPFNPIPGHPSNVFFPEVMEDFPGLLAYDSKGWPNPHSPLPDISSIDYVAESVDFFKRQSNLSKIRSTDVQGILAKSDEVRQGPKVWVSLPLPSRTKLGDSLANNQLAGQKRRPEPQNEVVPTAEPVPPPKKLRTTRVKRNGNNPKKVPAKKPEEKESKRKPPRKSKKEKAAQNQWTPELYDLQRQLFGLPPDLEPLPETSKRP
ncbi:MAG: hypothetical protein Q9166_006860 [cf. Caloplaca sp. 2 TL-2023]